MRLASQPFPAFSFAFEGCSQVLADKKYRKSKNSKKITTKPTATPESSGLRIF
jgi:hypothetical protein